MTIEPLEFFDVPPTGISEMYAAMGRALWACQGFEEVLAYYICLLFDMPPGIAENIAHKALDEKRRKTLGQLVREVTDKQSPEFPDSLEKRLFAFRDERNWLAHRIQHENHTDLFHQERFVRLLARLDAIKAEAKTLAKAFDEMLDEWSRGQGITQDDLRKRMEQTISEWRSSDKGTA